MSVRGDRACGRFGWGMLSAGMFSACLFSACLFSRGMVATGLLIAAVGMTGCTQDGEAVSMSKSTDGGGESVPGTLSDKYATVRLTSDLSVLTDAERALLPLLIDAAKHMNEAFWIQAYGDKRQFLASMPDRETRRYAEINYGPWDRLENNEAFIPGVGAKPKGANFYPPDMTKEEFEAACRAAADGGEQLRSPYTMVRRNRDGELHAVPYHEFFKHQVKPASAKLQEASQAAMHPALKVYLQLRAQALLKDHYFTSDLAWMDMKTNTVDVVIGPIENYEDALFGYKTAYEAYVLIKDKAWSERLSHYATLLPDLQRSLPVEDKYKQESPGTDSDLNAYDVVYYAGDCNAASKTIAINLPNDEEVQLRKGTRRLQLKNAMRAKYDKILLPISKVLIDPSQRRHITFDAFFDNTMFHEVAHGLGIKHTINGRGKVREALKEQASALEEGKADILGLYMVTKLYEDGELTNGELMDNYVTFLAGIFRSVRFGAASAHGRANMLRFNVFKEMGAFERVNGCYRVDPVRIREAMNALSEKILTLQGTGDYEGTRRLMEQKGTIGSELQADLDRLRDAGIPVDIVFEQGMDVLGG